ncbi:MAG: alginate lyase family protein [bacterium]
MNTLFHHKNLELPFVVHHRLVRPALWKLFLQSQSAHLTDEDFLKRLSFHGTLEQVVQRFHSQARHRFFFHPRNQKDFFLHLLERSQSSQSILADAGDVLTNTFEALGSGRVHLGDLINWHLDFKSGKVWPLKALSRDEILDLGERSDIKTIWELSRFHQVWWLGKAYWMTRSERYAEKFQQLITNWIEENPTGIGPNWANAMEPSIRVCNWIAGYYFFCESKSISSSFWLRFLKHCYLHGFFIEHHIEAARPNGNHFLSDVVGLLFLGMFFRDTTVGHRWLTWSVHHLESEIQRQVYPDGVHFEKSVSYHRFVLELFSTAAILCRKNSIQLSKAYMKRLEQMFGYTLDYTRPDGSAPLNGDADDGFLYRLSMDQDVNDHRPLLSVGALLFERQDFKETAAQFSQQALLLFGGEGFEQHQLLKGTPSPLASRAYPHGAYYIIRNANAHLFIDADDVGLQGKPGHGHSDTLSFEFWIDGFPCIVDSGTYCYTSDPQRREELRSTRSHNCLMVDGHEPATFDGLWSVKKDLTSPCVLEWNIGKHSDTFVGEQHGFQHLNPPVTHRRSFKLDKQTSQLTISDQLSGSGFHTIQWFFHFDSCIKVRSLQDQEMILASPSGEFLFSSSHGPWILQRGLLSPSYGVLTTTLLATLTVNKELPLILTVGISRIAREIKR